MIAQMAERSFRNREAAGSIPARSTIFAGLAQLAVRPICIREVGGSTPSVSTAHAARLDERQITNLEVVGSSPTVCSIGEVLRKHGGLQNRKRGFDSYLRCQSTASREVWSFLPDLESGDRRFKSCLADHFCRRSTVVVHLHGKQGVRGSIPRVGTIGPVRMDPHPASEVGSSRFES